MINTIRLSFVLLNILVAFCGVVEMVRGKKVNWPFIFAIIVFIITILIPLFNIK